MQPENEGMEMASSGEQTTLSAEQYPELKNAQVGQYVEGRFTGKVNAVNDGQVTIQYDSVELSTENKADKSLKDLSAQSSGYAATEDDVEI